MRNIITIARRELASYFESPIAYVVIGFFALLFGYFFFSILQFFVAQSMQMSQMNFEGAPPVNVNLMMIRPLLLNAGLLVLFALPMVTMRTFSEEKRSGTIELLLTSPLTDWQIILGKFFGALGLYALMLLITLLDIGLLFAFGNPEWKPIATSYLGLLLMGGAFIAVGIFISSLTKNQVVAVFITFATFLMLYVINWVEDAAGPVTRTIVGFLSITDRFDDFSKGIIDTKHIVYYLSFITFGLFLTARSLDSERWKG